MAKVYKTKDYPMSTLKIASKSDQKIPSDARLYDFKEASELLSQQFGKNGFTVTSLRKTLNKRGIPGWHYVMVGGYFKLYLEAIKQSVVKGEWW